MSYMILVFLILNKMAFAYKISDKYHDLNEDSVENGNYAGNNLENDEDLEKFKNLLLLKLIILTDYLKSPYDVEKLDKSVDLISTDGN